MCVGFSVVIEVVIVTLVGVSRFRSKFPCVKYETTKHTVLRERAGWGSSRGAAGATAKDRAKLNLRPGSL